MRINLLRSFQWSMVISNRVTWFLLREKVFFRESERAGIAFDQGGPRMCLFLVTFHSKFKDLLKFRICALIIH